MLKSTLIENSCLLKSSKLECLELKLLFEFHTIYAECFAKGHSLFYLEGLTSFGNKILKSKYTLFNYSF